MSEASEGTAACNNTDRHLWPETSDPDAPAETLHVTEGGGIGINIGGHVIIKPLRDWHALARSPAQTHAQISELDDASNACLELAAKHSLATGHGDTVGDMIREFSGQIRTGAPAQGVGHCGDPVGKQWIVDLIRDQFDPKPSSWKAGETGWDDGAETIADSILANLPLLHAASPAQSSWQPGDSTPAVKSGHQQEFIIAVRRVSSGKVHTFSCSYLNAFPIEYEWCPKDDDRSDLCDGCSEGCPTSGWFILTGDSEYESGCYQKLTLKDGDKIEGWQDLPQWPSSVPSTDRLGEFVADYSPLSAEDIAKEDPELMKLHARSRPVSSTKSGGVA